MDWRQHVSVDPAVCHGQPCIAGSRVLVSVVLDNLAAGEVPDAIAAAYHISTDDVRAAIQFASELAKDSIVALPVDVA